MRVRFPDVPEQSLGFVLSDVARLLRRFFNRKAQDLGLTQAQWQILAYLFHSEGLKQAELANILEMQPISVARIVDRMEAAGWVERRRDPTDRRAFNLHLTEKAGPIFKDLKKHAMETRERALLGLSAGEREALFSILVKMRENLIAECDTDDKERDHG